MKAERRRTPNDEWQIRNPKKEADVIVFDKGGWRFNYRVAGILFDGDRVLLERDIVTGQCCLLGGRVEFGESAPKSFSQALSEVRTLRDEFETVIRFVSVERILADETSEIESE